MKTTTEYLGKVSITCNGKWDINRQYDRLCLVHDGFFASYISRKFVPSGTDLVNEEYWQPVANLKQSFKDELSKFIAIIAQLQLKLKSARIVVNNDDERNNLTATEIAVGCEVYVLETKQSWILDEIVIPGNTKRWHIEVDSKIDSDEKYEIEGQFDNLTADRAICDAHGNIIHDTYITRDTIHNYIDKVIDDFLKSISITIPDGSISFNSLSEQLKQTIGNNNTITNFPDEEDITVTSDNVLKLKDRIYSNNTYAGKGYKILRKNMMGQLNLLEQNMIKEPNTIYEIRYDFYLDGATINIPDNSVLLFNGGTFNNGIINLNKAKLTNLNTDKDFGTATNNGDFSTGQVMWFTADSALKVYNGSEWKIITLS